MDLNINAEEHFNQTYNTNNSTTTNTKINTMDTIDLSRYGLPLDEVYNLARNFIKGIYLEKKKNFIKISFLLFFLEKEGKAIHLTYDDRNLMNVLPKQIFYGSYKEEADKNIGFLDLVGKDRMLVDILVFR